MEIKNKKVLITGANRGIGLALAEMFAESGAHLILVNRSEDKELPTLLQKKGAASVQVILVDLSSRNAIDEFLRKNSSLEPDILVNNSGQLTGGLLEEQSLDEIYSLIQVNVTALIHLTQAFLPGMLKRGSGKIINNSSVSGVMHFPCATVYAASKAAVLAFTESLQAELQGTGVSTLLMITPGINTRMFNEIPDKYGKNLEMNLGKGIPPKKYAQMIKECILNDSKEFRPSGFEGVGLFLAQHTPGLFQKIVNTRFKR